MANHFVNPASTYKRNLDIVGAYIEDCALYVSKLTGDPIETCRAFIKDNIKSTGLFPFKDPSVEYLQRDKNGDRSLKVGSLYHYLSNAVTQQNIIAPTLTCYLHPHKKKSLLAEYISVNLDKRRDYKHKMFVAEMEGRQDVYLYFDNLQNSAKIKNNSLSGAHASPSTVLYNKSSHSTLTSTCRSAASYGNAHNEKFIMGNRHYWAPSIVLGNILAIVRVTNYETLQRAMDLYSIHYPTAEEAMACVTYSSRLYWSNSNAEQKIYELLQSLKPIERAAFVYIGDMYHLAKYNDVLVRTFMGNIIQTAKGPIDNPDDVFKILKGDLLTFVTLLSSDIMAGNLLKDVKKDRPNDYAIVAHTGKMVIETLDRYEPLITGLWKPNFVPSSIAGIESMVRRCVVVSDTDSTIFTNQHWSMWFCGQLEFTQPSYAVAYTMTFITSQIVSHTLAMMSANLGAPEENIHQLNMKNEYFFPVFAITPRAKHYYAFISAREGNVFKKMKMEVKGVEMRSSTAPPEINQTLITYVQDIMNKTMTGNKITIHDILGPVASLEKQIINDIQKGGFKYMRLLQIKDPTAYIDGESAAPFMHYKMWQEVFAPKYGQSVPPPYPVVKISVDLDKPKLVIDWLNAMVDQDMANRMRQYLESYQKDKITGFLFPQELLELNGIPTEVIPAIDMRKLVYNVMSPFYLVLESLGFFFINDKLTRLVSDHYHA